jgi:hypothetical protein
MLAAVAVALALAALASRLAQREAPSPRPSVAEPLAADQHSAPPSAPEAAAPALPKSLSRAAAGVPQGAPLPGPDVPLDAAIAALRPLAAQGRTDAMRELGARLLACRIAHRGSDEDIRRNEIERMLRLESQLQNGERFVNEADATASMIEQAIRIRDQCSHVDDLESAHWLDWIRRAADAGDTDAMLSYAQKALADVGVLSPLPVDEDEAERRRERAEAYRQRALQNGNCNALLDLEYHYARDLPGDVPDAASAYAYAYARWRWEGENDQGRTADVDTAWSDYLARQAQGLDAAGLDAARRQGESVYARYCKGRPMRP